MKKTVLVLLGTLSFNLCLAAEPPWVSFSEDKIEQLFLYLPGEGTARENLHLEGKVCDLYRTKEIPRGTKPDSMWEHFDSREDQVFGSTIFEGQFYYPKDQPARLPLISLKAQGPIIEFCCGTNRRGDRGPLRGRINLSTYTASIWRTESAGGETREDWKVAHAVSKPEGFQPLVREFYEIGIRGTDRQIFPETAFWRVVASEWTGKIIGGRRRILKRNRQLAASLREKILAWGAEFPETGLLVNQATYFSEAFGELFVYLPAWLAPEMASQFPEEIKAMKKISRWGFELYSATPRWQDTVGNQVPTLTMNAFLGAFVDQRTTREHEESCRRGFAAIKSMIANDKQVAPEIALFKKRKSNSLNFVLQAERKLFWA